MATSEQPKFQEIPTDVQAVVKPGPAAEPVVAYLLTQTGTQAALVDLPVVVGRGVDCDLAVPDDAACSRNHLRITLADGAIRITDLQSRNGTYVNGERITGSVTVRRAVVRLGDSVLVVGAVPDADVVAKGVGPFIGGPAIARCCRIAERVATTPLPVVVTGETGTGKELFAAWVHELSGRKGAFVPVNCAALTDAQLEAELFGLGREPFDVQSAGLLSAALGGTLFLDEVADLPLHVQAKLVSLLEARITPAGGGSPQPADVRVISATHVDLRGAVERGEFRADLYARLAAVEVKMPALRDHSEDIPALVTHLLSRVPTTATVSADAIEALARYSWPGNVRELEHALRRALLLSANSIVLEHLPEPILRGFRSLPPRTAAKAVEISRPRLEAELQNQRGNLRQVAQTLGISRSRVYRLISRWSLEPDAYRQGVAAAGDGDAA
ncbi:MAG: sigma 54-interacting transcriptional regulator [Kofleriaceae bacterium]